MLRDSTTDLTRTLQATDTDQLHQFLKAHSASMVPGERPFSAYMRALLREKKISQQALFVAAGLPERYGYKLISQEKHTRQRDYILRLTIAAGFDLKETQRALRLYEMPDLYPKRPRDAALMIAINQGLRDLDQVDSLLLASGQERLKEVDARSE